MQRAQWLSLTPSLLLWKSSLIHASRLKTAVCGRGFLWSLKVCIQIIRSQCLQGKTLTAFQNKLGGSHRLNSSLCQFDDIPHEDFYRNNEAAVKSSFTYAFSSLISPYRLSYTNASVERTAYSPTYFSIMCSSSDSILMVYKSMLILEKKKLTSFPPSQLPLLHESLRFTFKLNCI